MIVFQGTFSDLCLLVDEILHGPKPLVFGQQQRDVELRIIVSEALQRLDERRKASAREG